MLIFEIVFNKTNKEKSIIVLYEIIQRLVLGYSSEGWLRQISSLMPEIDEADKLTPSDEVVGYTPPDSIRGVENLPAVKVAMWEKQLQNIYNEESPEVLVEMSRTWLEKYFSLVKGIDMKKTRSKA